MKRGALYCLVFFSLVLSANAMQTTLPTAGTTPVPQPSPNFPRGGNRGSQVSIAIPTTSDVAPSGTIPDGLALQQMIVHNYAQSIYRKPTAKELAAIAPRSGVEDRFHDFLAGQNTGIFKLAPDHKCEENTKVISATDDCLKYTMPGAGSSYSFRAGTYRIRDLADLNYSDNMLRISGMMMQGMFVNLGDVPIETVSLESKGLTYLADFKPVTDFERAREIDNEIVAGLTRDGFLYKRSLPAVDDTTYALRAVAYRGKLMRSVRGIPYNEFDFDKRRDVIVAFRIAYRDPDGGLTIIWKMLSSAEAPKLKPPTGGSDASPLRSDTPEGRPRNKN
jgi:hypothetical protein